MCADPVFTLFNAPMPWTHREHHSEEHMYNVYKYRIHGGPFIGCQVQFINRCDVSWSKQIYYSISNCTTMVKLTIPH